MKIIFKLTAVVSFLVLVAFFTMLFLGFMQMSLETYSIVRTKTSEISDQLLKPIVKVDKVDASNQYNCYEWANPYSNGEFNPDTSKGVDWSIKFEELFEKNQDQDLQKQILDTNKQTKLYIKELEESLQVTCNFYHIQKNQLAK